MKVTFEHTQTIINEVSKHVDEQNIAFIIRDMIHIGDWKWVSEYESMTYDYMVKHQKELYWALVLEKNKNLKVNQEQRSKLWELSSKNNYKYF